MQESLVKWILKLLFAFKASFMENWGTKYYVNKQSAARFIDDKILSSNKKVNILFVLKHQTSL